MAAADRIMTGLDRRKRAGGRSAEEKNRSRRSRKADAEEEPEKDSGIYSTPARKKAKRRKKKDCNYSFEVLILLSVIIFAAYSYVDKRLSGMSRLDWNPDEIKNIEISEEKQGADEGLLDNRRFWCGQPEFISG